MRTLLIDNYDSYTYNLFQLLAEVNGREPHVVRNDAMSWAELAEIGFDNVVLSPGPGHPALARDFGVCAEVLRHADVPVLGVCLGHQGMIAAENGVVERAPVPMHGRLSRVWHDSSELFDGVAQGFLVVRYHSLVAVEPLPPELACTARTADNLVMAVRHRLRPQWGVQFHPESIATEHGTRLLCNFRDLTRRRYAVPATTRPAVPVPVAHTEPAAPTGSAAPYQAHVRALDGWFDPEHVFAALYATSPAAFWLDSSRAEPNMARFSFLGAPDGPLSRLVTYDVHRREVSVRGRAGTTRHRTTVFDYLDQTLARGVVRPALPFDFVGGYVGYVGYEVKADCGGDATHRSPHPDAALCFADRFIAFDHEEGRVYLFALTDEAVPGAGVSDAEQWFEHVRIAVATTDPPPEPDIPATAGPDLSSAGEARLDVDRPGYLAAIAECLDELAAGESYEICLTNRARSAPLDVPPLEAYRVLRRINPAPYSAYLRHGGVAVLSSSPERYLRIGKDGWIEAKPIKGTAPRGPDSGTDERIAHQLSHDEKTRAENLMIVDLLRNDLGRVSEIGTVHVPRLMAVESYETVHQLVSTVRGRLRTGLTAVDCLRATFPGGSMTGAPKRRTMQIIDRLESTARGVYSGTIGFLSLDGTADLSIVIRTVVCDPTGVTIGTGGAIVAQSDPAAEYDEIVLKAAAPARAVAIARDGRGGYPGTVPIGSTVTTEAGAAQ